MRRVEARAPTRIDLAGGTLDIPPLDLLVPGAATLNVAIDVDATATVEGIERGVEVHAVDRDLRLRFDRPEEVPETGPGALLTGLIRHLAPGCALRLVTDCASPAGAGLGGSSALAIAAGSALARFAGRPLPPDRLLAIARDVETRVLKVPTGTQDYLAALEGGALGIVFGVGGARVERLHVDLAGLRRRLVLVYSGEPRSSGINNWEVTRAFLDGDAEVRARLEGIARQVALARDALAAGDWEELARAIDGEWQERRRLAPGVSTPAIDRLMEAARRAGALAGKVCGAGGGGCVVLLAPPEHGIHVEEAARAAGMRVLEFAFARSGVQVQGAS